MHCLGTTSRLIANFRRVTLDLGTTPAATVRPTKNPHLDKVKDPQLALYFNSAGIC